MEKHKIYRWAFRDQIEDLTIPDGTMFHVLVSHDNYKDTIYGAINQNTYIAIIPYTKEDWDLIKKAKHQTIALEYYNVSNKHIVMILKDVCKIKDTFPLSDEKIEFPESYILLRGSKQIKSEDKSLEEICKMSEQEKKNWFFPVIAYVKIHGMSSNIDSKLDVTMVNVGSWIDDRKVFSIERCDFDVDKLLESTAFIKVDNSYKAQFIRAFNQVSSEMK